MNRNKFHYKRFPRKVIDYFAVNLFSENKNKKSNELKYTVYVFSTQVDGKVTAN